MCFYSAATLCVNKDLIIITMLRVVINKIKYGASIKYCARCEVLQKNYVCMNSEPSKIKLIFYSTDSLRRTN